MKINQFVPNLDYGDAISNHILEIKKTLIAAGYDSNIYYINSYPELNEKKCQHYLEYHPDENNIAIFHFSIKSALDDFVFDLKEKVIIIYHNTTPAEYFYGINDGLSRLLENTDESLIKLKNKTSLAIGVSDFNSNYLLKLGFKKVTTIPLIIDFDKYEGVLNKSLYKKYKDNYTNILFVGKISAHKKQEDLLKVFFIYNKYINPKSRLFIVGNWAGMEVYYDKLIKLKDELKLENVFITNKVSFEDLSTYYKMADVFLSMSEHEGFMVPLPESMKLKIPIIAFNSSAIPYTLGGAGIIFNKKIYEAVAELVDYATKNKEEIIERQNKRLVFFNQDEIKRKFINEIEKLK